MGWFKGKKDKGDDKAGAEVQEKTAEPEVADPSASSLSKSKLVHATSVQSFPSMQSPQATVNRKPEVIPELPPGRAAAIAGAVPIMGPTGTAPTVGGPTATANGLTANGSTVNAPATNGSAANGPTANGPPMPSLRPISTVSNGNGTAAPPSEISVATPVQATSNSSTSSVSMFTASANSTFKPKPIAPVKGSYVQQTQERVAELEDQVARLQQELNVAINQKAHVEDELRAKNVQVQSLMKQLQADSSSSPNSKRSDVDADGASSGQEVRTTDDLHAALKAFREQSQSKLADTLRQNQELRHQVENYESMCRTIGEVLRDYEWLQQCRIVTGDLDLGRLRKSMMKLWHTGKTRSVLPVLAMVLAFGPDDVARCRTVISTAKQEADMVDYIPEIIEHNMDENMKRDAITIYIEAHKSFTEDTNIAMYLTDKFAEKYKGEWHCVCGEQYALSSCYESKVVKFKSGHRSVILWSN